MTKNVLTFHQIWKRMFVYILCVAPAIPIASALLKNRLVLLFGMVFMILSIYLLLRHWLTEDVIDINHYVIVQMDLKSENPSIYDEVQYLHNTRNNLARLTPINPIVFQHVDNPQKYVVKATPTSKEYYPFEFEHQESPYYKYITG